MASLQDLDLSAPLSPALRSAPPHAPVFCTLPFSILTQVPSTLLPLMISRGGSCHSQCGPPEAPRLAGGKWSGSESEPNRQAPESGWRSLNSSASFFGPPVLSSPLHQLLQALLSPSSLATGFSPRQAAWLALGSDKICLGCLCLGFTCRSLNGPVNCN